MNGKIVILGAGHVGSHVARALAAGSIGSEIVLVDCVPDKAAAQAMDVAGEERARLTVPQLLDRFRENAGRELATDRMLLG